MNRCKSKLECDLANDHEGAHLCKAGAAQAQLRTLELIALGRRLMGRFVATEETEYARGYNAGLREAITVIATLTREARTLR